VPPGTLTKIDLLSEARPTADGAVQPWADAANHTFTNHRLVTGVALQDAAGTLALLCQIASGTFRDAARRRILDPDTARDAARLLSDAAASCRKAATWQSNIQLGGRAHEHS